MNFVYSTVADFRNHDVFLLSALSQYSRIIKFKRTIYYVLKPVYYDCGYHTVRITNAYVQREAKIFFEQLHRHCLHLIWQNDPRGSEKTKIKLQFKADHVTMNIPIDTLETTYQYKPLNSYLEDTFVRSGLYGCILKVNRLEKLYDNTFVLKCSIDSLIDL